MDTSQYVAGEEANQPKIPKVPQVGPWRDTSEHLEQSKEGKYPWFTKFDPCLIPTKLNL